MYRKVKISERLPETNKEIIFIDKDGNSGTYIRTDFGFNVKKMNDNEPFDYWLEEIEPFDSKKLIGKVQDHFELMKDYNWDWKSFYNGWLEGRFEMLFEIKGTNNKI